MKKRTKKTKSKIGHKKNPRKGSNKNKSSKIRKIKAYLKKRRLSSKSKKKKI